jgi:hypothetical protein
MAGWRPRGNDPHPLRRPLTSPQRSADTRHRCGCASSPELGDRRMSELRRGHIQDVVDELVADLLAPATIQATIIPLKAICRREVHRGRLAVNPTAGIELPAVRGDATG